MFFENEIAVPKHGSTLIWVVFCYGEILRRCRCCCYFSPTAQVYLHFEASHMVNIITTTETNVRTFERTRRLVYINIWARRNVHGHVSEALESRFAHIKMNQWKWTQKFDTDVDVNVWNCVWVYVSRLGTLECICHCYCYLELFSFSHCISPICWPLQ